MDPLLLTIVLRAIERLFIVAAGAGAIYLGYRLFLAMPNRDRSSGKLELPGGVSIFLSRVGPGVFFSLFGATVIAMALQFGVSFSDVARTTGQTARTDSASAPVDTLAAAKRKTTYSGIGEAGGADAQAGETDRVNAAVTIRNLNRALPALRDGLPPSQRLDIIQAVRDAKLRLMRASWHEPSWGSYTRFAAWIDDGEPNPPPADIRAAAEIYKSGDAGGGK